MPRSAFLESIPIRQPNFVDKIVQDLSDLSTKQALALPFTGTLGLASGIVKGATFGLVDLDDPLQDILGDLAPPETLSNAISVAGEIGGSFVPFIGASKIAGGIYKGIDLGSRLAKGAITFGGPEIARQVIQDDINALGAVRSAATGAVWSLPLSRALLAPSVAGTELALGAPPEEAVIAGGLAGILGSLGGRKKAAEMDLEKVGLFLAPGPERKLLGPGRIIRAQPPPTPQTTVEWVRETPPSPSPRLQKLAERRATGRPLGRVQPIFGKDPLAALDEISLIRLSAARAGPQKGALLDFAADVERMSKVPTEQLRSAYNASKAQLGVDDPATKAIRYALAQSEGTYAEVDSVANILTEKVSQGPSIGQIGKNNHYEIMGGLSKKAVTMMESTDPNIVRQGSDVQALIERLNRSLSRGEKKKVDDTIEKLTGVLGAGPTEATADAFLAGNQVRDIVKKLELPKAEEYIKGIEGAYPDILDKGLFRRTVEGIIGDKRKAANEVAPAIATFERALEAEGIPKSFQKLTQDLKDANLILKFTKRTGVRKSGAIRNIRENMRVVTEEGKEVKKFRTEAEGRRWLNGLKDGSIDPGDIHELRALSNLKGITIFFTGTGLILTNNVTGETVDNVGSLQEAVELVRRAPDIADKVRDIGPRIPGLPPLPGVGGIGGLHTEQAPPFAPMILEEQ